MLLTLSQNIKFYLALFLFPINRIKKLVDDQREKFRTRFFTLTQAEAIGKSTVCSIKNILSQQGKPVPKPKDKKGKGKGKKTKNVSDSVIEIPDTSPDDEDDEEDEVDDDEGGEEEEEEEAEEEGMVCMESEDEFQA